MKFSGLQRNKALLDLGTPLFCALLTQHRDCWFSSYGELATNEPEPIHITPGVGVERVTRFIPDDKRVLKRVVVM